jgi:glycosyltransferase involved in cell wall biosynthesis
MEWEVPSNAKLILYAARMTIQKQPIVALEAFEFIAKQIPDIFMVMVGDGELLDEVREKIQTLSSKDRIRLKSFYTDMPGVYHASDIFILPSLWEGLPIALLEAMSMGKVVVASAVDGTKELIQHRHNGLLIDVSDSISRKLGRSIVEVVSDQFLFKELSSQAIKTVEIDYNSVIMANKIKDIYQECLIC